jgi:hypothetical protein
VAAARAQERQSGPAPALSARGSPRAPSAVAWGRAASPTAVVCLTGGGSTGRLRRRSRWRHQDESERQLLGGGRSVFEIVDLPRIEHENRWTWSALRRRQRISVLCHRAPVDGRGTGIQRDLQRRVAGEIEQPQAVSGAGLEIHRLRLRLPIHHEVRQGAAAGCPLARCHSRRRCRRPTLERRRATGQTMARPLFLAMLAARIDVSTQRDQ